MEVKFIEYHGETGGLMTSDKYLNFKWLDPTCNILFSVTRQGNAATTHFTSDKTGLPKLKKACKDWCEFCFWLFDWCTMVIGIVKKRSVSKLMERCGFIQIISNNGKSVYIRRK